MAAILVLLAMLLVPSLEAARGFSRQATCMDRLRAIAGATRTYTNEDAQSFALPIHPLQFNQDPDNPTWIGAYEWGGKSGVGVPGFVPGPSGSSAFLTSKFGTKAGFGPYSRPLNRYLYPSGFVDHLCSPFGYSREGGAADTLLDLTVFRCPGDDGPPSGAHCAQWIARPQQSSYDFFGTSYAANIFHFSFIGGGPIYSHSPYLRPISRVPNPARVYHYEENIGRFAWACKREQCDFIQPGVDPGPTKAVRGWHGKNWVYNRAFLDGHVQQDLLILEGTRDPEGYYEHYVAEQVFDDPDEQSSKRCVIIRGNGWQKDTHPAPGVPTGLYWTGQGRASYEDCVDNGSFSTASAPVGAAY